MNKEQQDFFKIPFEQREAVFIKKFPDGAKLKEKLLAIGGTTVVWWPEDDGWKIIQLGDGTIKEGSF